MKINCIPKESSRLVLTIYIDDEPWGNIHTKIFGRNPTFPASDSLDDFNEKFKVQEYSKAMKYSLDCLSRRSYPTAQLKNLLLRNFVSLETIEKILVECMRLGYLNDEEWIQRFIKGHLAKHEGSQKILMKLRSKGISSKIVEKYLTNLVDQTDVQKSIEHLLKTKYRKRDLSDFREKQKVFAALVRKGFAFEAISECLLKSQL